MSIKNKVKLSEIERLARESYSAKPEPETRFPPSPYYRFLRSLVERYQPTIAVELGVCGGGGSFYMCRGWDQCLVVGIDIQREYPDNIRYIMDTVDNFEFVLGDSVTELLKVPKKYGRADVIFIDTTHDYEQTVCEFEAALLTTNRPAIICMDDLNRPAVGQFWNELDPQYQKIELPYLHELTPGGGSFGVVILEE